MSFGFGFGNVGWVPLAPFEAFRPWYGPGYGFRNAVLVNNTNIAGVYRNARVNGAVTSMRAGEFGRAGSEPFDDDAGLGRRPFACVDDARGRSGGGGP